MLCEIYEQIKVSIRQRLVWVCLIRSLIYLSLVFPDLSKVKREVMKGNFNPNLTGVTTINFSKWTLTTLVLGFSGSLHF